MQLTATEASCPLCKHPVSAGGEHSDPTRLCDDCRRMVHTIRSNSNTVVAATDAAQARSIPHASSRAVPVQTDVQISDEAAARGITESVITRVCESDLSDLDPLASVDRDPFDIDELFGDVFVGSSEPAEPPRHAYEPSRESVLQVSPAIPEPVHEVTPQPESTPSAPAEFVDGPPEETVVVDAAPVSAAKLTDSDTEPDSRIDCTTDVQPFQPLLRHEVVTDSLEAPVQEGTYSQGDYPLLMPDAGLSKAVRLKLSVAAVLVVCSVIAGYFLIYRASIQAAQSKQANADKASIPVTGSAAVPLPLSLEAAPESEPTASQGLQPAEDNFEGRYSLQAAAFPNEAGANEFCERLKRAGVPAYVVSAEIAGRGRWFRVRVGRFESAQEADRFALESRRRARAARLNLQLIVSSYDKP